MGLQLTLAFIGVSVAAVLVAMLVASLTIDADFSRLVRQQEADLTRSVSVATSAAYNPFGWQHPTDLSPVIALVSRTGSAVEIRDERGQVIRASPGFGSIQTKGPQVTDAVVVRGKRVGSVTMAFGHGVLIRVIDVYDAERWRAMFVAAAIAALIALLVALPLSRLVARPVDELIWAARGSGRGDLNARVGEVRGLGQLKELSMAYDELAAAREEQDQIRRNLVADVAHELRTPVAVLQAGHEAMLDGLVEPTPEQLVSLRDEVLRLARMVDDLQRLASAEAAALQLTLVECDLGAVAATAAASLVESFDAADVTLVERLAVVKVMSDPLRMHEVAVNLLTNAVKFTPAGGQVILQTEQVNGSGQLKVIDTGIGIPAHELPRVAERFFRGQRSSQVAGSGIGLTIVAELVRAHHGRLNFDSQPGEGTSVTVTLPLARARESGQPSAERRDKPPPASRRRHGGIIGHHDNPHGHDRASMKVADHR